MTDREQIEKLYHEMYHAMVAKDREELYRIHDDGFVLTHMTGLNQDRETYINGILDGTLNYFSEQTASLEIQITGDTAAMTGKRRVTAAVFGGGIHTWRLRLQFSLVKKDGEWKISSAQAGTY